MLTELQIKRLERPLYSASIGTSPPSVKVSDLDALPEQYRRVTVEPNKIAIGAALTAGDAVSGAAFGNPEPRITIRTH
jgi:hypothetical protein